MRVWHAGQAMTRSRAASSSRRAAGRLRLGGKAGRRLAGGVEQGVAPDERDEGEVAVQARPGPRLVVAQPELLLAILVEPLDRPALVGQAELLIERSVIKLPGDVPCRLALLAGQRALAEQPAERAGRVAMRPVDAQAAGLPLAALLLGIEDGDRRPLVGGHGRRPRLGGVQRSHLARVGTGPWAFPPRPLGQRAGRRPGDLL